MKKPAVTVLMPVYNGERYLREAIESILNQSFKNFEFLIIDDGSTDRSVVIVKSYRDPRIRLIRHNKNQKLITTLNEGIRLAKASLIARMDADDISSTERLARQVEFLQRHPGVVLVGCSFEAIDEKGLTVYHEPPFTDDATIRLAMAVVNAFAHGSVMFRRRAALRVGGYLKKAYLVEDYDFWTRLANVGKVANLPVILYRWRLNPRGESISKSKQQQKAASVISNRVWETFGSAGPWRLTWQSVFNRLIGRIPASSRRRIAELHIHLARGYFARNQKKIAVRHILAAILTDPSFPPFYFYLLMKILPKPLFYRIEAWTMSIRRALRGW